MKYIKKIDDYFLINYILENTKNNKVFITDYIPNRVETYKDFPTHDFKKSNEKFNMTYLDGIPFKLAWTNAHSNETRFYRLNS